MYMQAFEHINISYQAVLEIYSPFIVALRVANDS